MGRQSLPQIFAPSSIDFEDQLKKSTEMQELDLYKKKSKKFIQKYSFEK